MRPAHKTVRSNQVATLDPTENKEPCTDKHYSVAELAEIWKLSENTIRRIFENEPGVLKWGATEGRFKRRYITLRIPETVALRVHRQLRAAG